MIRKLATLFAVVGLTLGSIPVTPAQAAPLCVGVPNGSPILVSGDPYFTDGTVSGGNNNFTIGHFRFIANAASLQDYSIYTLTVRVNGNADALIRPKLTYSRYPGTTSSAWIGAYGYGYENADGSWAAQDLRIDLKPCEMVDLWVTADISAVGRNGVTAGDTFQIEVLADTDHPFGAFVRGSSTRLDESQVTFDAVGPTFTLIP